MNITADTNLLARAAIGDDLIQAAAAEAELATADLVAVTVPALCELVWVMSQGYEMNSARISESIRGLLDTTNVIANAPEVEAGLAFLDAGGDFADGVIAYEGDLLGGETFVSFDRKAVRLIQEQGGRARLLS